MPTLQGFFLCNFKYLQVQCTRKYSHHLIISTVLVRFFFLLLLQTIFLPSQSSPFVKLRRGSSCKVNKSFYIFLSSFFLLCCFLRPINFVCFSEFDAAAVIVHVGEVYLSESQKKQWIFMTDGSGSTSEIQFEEMYNRLLAVSFCSPTTDNDSSAIFTNTLSGTTVCELNI